MSDGGPLTVVALGGSLRAGSLTRGLLGAAVGLAPERLAIEPLEVRDLPMYDGDLDTDDPPAAVAALKAQLTAADGLLVVTPEYNHSVPGVVKNAIDWASRPAYRSPLRDLPVTMIAAAPGPYGGARALAALKAIMLGCGSALLPWPDFAMPAAHERLDGEVLTDEVFAGRLSAQLAAFAEWIDALSTYGANASR
ncbi:MAG TPA: NAD(P)H-dependent oxidoreductase [Acidimicrobiales bacterium]|nr:NAD(P)H-dependent oxidoreductase [Acidimicrobiales bacterium]